MYFHYINVPGGVFFAFYGAYAGGKGGENGSKLKLYRFLDA